MISSVGVVPPVILPLPDEYDAVAQVTTVASADDPMAVDVTLRPDTVIQTLPDGSVLTLDAVVAPHAAVVRYLPAGGLLAQEAWPGVVGPFEQDAWVIDALADKSPIAPLLPQAVPAPVYWVLEGIEPTSASAVLDSWLTDKVPGVHPQDDQCDGLTDPDQRGDTPADTWKQAMLAGRWSEPVPAETVLGLAAGDGTTSRLRIWTFGADGTVLPAAAILDAFATVDPTLLPRHPVVAGCHPLTADLPVRFYLRFDVWDVDLVSDLDQKGAPRTLRPDTVELIATSGAEITGTTWTWLGDDTGGVLEVARSNVAGDTITLQAEFPAGQQIRLAHNENRYFPANQPLTWLGVGWTAQDGVTPGTWSAFGGVLIGTRTQPAVFWVGTKVRLTAGYQQQRRDWFTQNKVGKLDTRVVSSGHVVHLFQSGPDPVDTFTTDDDGDISGVSFAVVPGATVDVTLARRLDLPSVDGGNATTLIARDDPAGSVFTDDQFHGGDAEVPVLFPAFTSGSVGPARLVVDAGKKGGGHTADAAAFHALKYAKFTHDVTTLLKTDSYDLPVWHEIVIKPDNADTPVTKPWLPHNPAGTTGPARTETTLGSVTGWFYANVVIHEYAHAMIAWLGGALKNPTNYDTINDAARALNNRLNAENGGGHNAWVVSNSGTGLDEGLPEFVECLLGYHDSFRTRMRRYGRPGRLKIPPKGQESWPDNNYEITDRTGTFIQLASDMGRRVEGVIASAFSEYIMDATKFPGFTPELDDTPNGFRPAHACLDDWAATVPASRPAQLQRLFQWLVTDPISAVYGGSVPWTGAYPAGSTNSYPAVYDYLRQLQATDPSGAGAPPTPEESFQYLFDNCLVRWNLERYDPSEPKPPRLDLDWLP